MENKNYKFILLSVAYIILFASSGLRLISYQENYLITLRLKGYYYLIGILIFAVYGAYKKDKKVTFIASILSLLIYGYSLYILIVNYNSNLTYELGFYVYILSFLIFAISLFISFGEKEIQKEDKDIKREEQKEFLIAKMMLGFKEIPYKSVVLLGLDEINNCLILSYMLDNKEYQIYFSYDSIIKIDYKSVPVLEEIDKKSTKYDDDNYKADFLLATFMFGGKPFLQQQAYSKLEEVPYEYKITDVKTIYNVNMLVMYNGEEKEIILNTAMNPENFINKFKQKSVNI